MLYVALGIAAAGVLFFFVFDEIKEHSSKSSSQAKSATPVKEKAPVVVDPDFIPSKGKLSFKEEPKPKVKKEEKTEGVLFEKPPTVLKSEFDIEREELKKEKSTFDIDRAELKTEKTVVSDFDLQRAELKKNAYENNLLDSLENFDNDDSNFYDDQEQQEEFKDFQYGTGNEDFLSSFGEMEEESFVDTFQTLPKIVKIMLIDGTLKRVD
ncbi:MAG: hypothetical protein WCR30_00955 [Clostridia bacterium]